MTKTITRLFDNYADAERAIGELERIGVPHRDISLIANNADGAHDRRGEVRSGDGRIATDHAADDAGKGAAAGGVIGGAGGLLAGLGVLAIPGLGPVVAAGWLASMAVGAVAGAAAGGATGGLVGALKHSGESYKDAHVYAEGVRRGGALVSAKVDDRLVAQTETALDGFNAVTAARRGEAYKQQGWQGFDESATAYTGDQVIRERTLYSA
jgi:hypothetical protein